MDAQKTPIRTGLTFGEYKAEHGEPPPGVVAGMKLLIDWTAERLAREAQARPAAGDQARAG